MFNNKTRQWSAIIQGCIRSDTTIWYNYTIDSNLKYSLYFDGQLMLEKDNL